VRTLLQNLGQAVRDKVHEDAWINALFSSYSYQNWIIPDCRHENEYKAIKDRGGICIRIDRALPEDSDSHISEHAWRDLTYDYVISNNGSLVDLEIEVDKFIKHIDLQ